MPDVVVLCLDALFTFVCAFCMPLSASLHLHGFVALFLKKLVRAWLDAHPSEIITLWISKHGNECATGNEAYAGIKPSTKQAFWAQVTTGTMMR